MGKGGSKGVRKIERELARCMVWRNLGKSLGTSNALTWKPTARWFVGDAFLIENSFDGKVGLNIGIGCEPHGVS